MKVIHGKKTSILVVQQWANSLGGELLSMEYHNALKPLKWQCKKGHEFVTTFNHVKNRGQWCPLCGRIKAQQALVKRMSTVEGREKISQSHLKRLNKQGKYVGKTQRQIAASIRDHTTGILRDAKKHKSILKLLGCSIDEFKKHLESLFKMGMTWKNRGFYGWHVDHVTPLANFDLTKPEQLKLACHYKNTQPMWMHDNLTKHCN